MRWFFIVIVFLASFPGKSQSDSTQYLNDTSITDTTKKFKWNQSLSFITEPKQRLMGAQYLQHFNHFKLGVFYQHSWANRWLYDTISSGLPYLVNDTALFYEINAYENKKSTYGITFETNFNPEKNKGKIVLGVSLYTGKYEYHQLYGDTYFKYYTDSLGNVFYHDLYDDPNYDPLLAWRFTLRYSHSEAVYRYFGIDPYIGYTGSIKKNISLGLFLRGKYNIYKWQQGYYWDPTQRIHRPEEKYETIKLSINMTLTFHLISKA